MGEDGATAPQAPNESVSNEEVAHSKEPTYGNLSALTEEEVKEIKRNFKVFDRNREGKMFIADILKLGRMSRIQPTDVDFMTVVSKRLPGLDLEGKVVLDDAMDVIALCKPLARVTQDNVLEAFKFLDFENEGHLSLATLRSLLTKFGQGMTDEEWDNFALHLGANAEGLVAYNDATKAIFKNYEETLNPPEA